MYWQIGNIIQLLLLKWQPHHEIKRNCSLKHVGESNSIDGTRVILGEEHNKQGIDDRESGMLGGILLVGL